MKGFKGRGLALGGVQPSLSLSSTSKSDSPNLGPPGCTKAWAFLIIKSCTSSVKPSPPCSNSTSLSVNPKSTRSWRLASFEMSLDWGFEVFTVEMSKFKLFGAASKAFILVDSFRP